MQKTKWTCFIVCLLFMNTEVKAASRPFGAGVFLGEPTALTGKVWVNDREAFDFGFGYWFHDYFLVYGDYLWHFDRFRSEHSFFAHTQPYLGVGASLFFSTSSPSRSRNREHSDSVSLAARIP